TASHLKRIDARTTVPVRPVALGGLAVLLGGAAAFWMLPQPSAHPESPLVVSLPNAVHFQGELEYPALPLVQFGDSSGANSRLDPYDTWRAPGPIHAGQTYSIVSSLPDYSPASLKAAEGVDMSLNRDPAGLSAAARQLAREAVAGSGPTRYDQVMALTTYLQA